MGPVVCPILALVVVEVSPTHRLGGKNEEWEGGTVEWDGKPVVAAAVKFVCVCLMHVRKISKLCWPHRGGSEFSFLLFNVSSVRSDSGPTRVSPSWKNAVLGTYCISSRKRDENVNKCIEMYFWQS